MEKYQFTDAQRTLLEGMQVPFAVYQFIHKKVVTLVVSDGFCKLFGYDDRAEAYHDMDHNMYRDTHPDDVARIADAAYRFSTEGGKFEVVYRTANKSGGYRVIHAAGEHIYTEDGVRLAQVWYTDEGDYTEDDLSDEQTFARSMRDVLREQSMVQGSRYDYLTGLPNMTYFFELAEDEKDAMLEQGGQPAILYIDFNGMHFFNSKFGFAHGDLLLKAFAKQLTVEFHSECCCRIGADHFAVLADEAGLENRLQRLFDSFGAMLDGQTPPVRVGIYPHRMGYVSVSAACDRAKLASAALIGSYTSGCRYYTAEMHEEAMSKRYFIENLDTAMREKWIRVFYQPIIRAVNEKICNAEALARWVDPVRGCLSPSSFVPVLEEAKLIYKLDLYVLERVLDTMQELKEHGYHIIPHSINLSRSDFEACDIVEEVCRRVDAAGIPRDRVTVEITESVIGSNFEYMQQQIARFRELGFPVWMDDFGSGYSSLDFLQSIRFDLLKFDMNFMRRFDESENGRIILTELMKMASAMGIDTICEGAETEEQIHFLQEIGCTKLQGFYYGKPNPFSQVLEWYAAHSWNDVEDPEETEYYESIGRVNLYDLRIIAKEEENSFQNAYTTLPMGVIEIRGNRTRFTRSNRTYREFIKRFFGIDLSVMGSEFTEFDAPFVRNVVQTCCEQGARMFYDEQMPDGSIVHSFARRIGVNRVDGTSAVIIAVLSVRKPDEETTYADIARALAADYYNIYVVDLDTDRYIEYSSRAGREELFMERHGADFFASARHDTMTRLYEGDREMFLSWFTKENIIRELDTQGAFNATYRLIDSGTPMYVNMKIIRMQSDKKRIIMGISVVDAYMKQKENYELLRKERDTMVRVMALSEGYLSLFTVDLETGHYVEYSSSDDFDSLGAPKEGEDFFRQAAADAEKYFHPEDKARFIGEFTLENVLREIRENGRYHIRYRLMLHGEPRPIILKAGLFRDGEEEKMAVGVREEKERGRD